MLRGGEALDLVAEATEALPNSMQAAVPIGGRFRICAVNPPYPRFDPDYYTASQSFDAKELTNLETLYVRPEHHISRLELSEPATSDTEAGAARRLALTEGASR